MRHPILTRVVALNLLPAPHVAALHVEQDLAVRREHVVRDDEVEDAADDAAEDLDMALASPLINYPDARSPGK